MQTFKNFLNESYSDIAQELLTDYRNHLLSLNKLPSDIEYNTVDKEYFITWESIDGTYSLYINRKNNIPFVMDMDTGRKKPLMDKSDLDNY